MTIDQKHELLMTAFSQKGFQEELDAVKDEILHKIESFAKAQEKICPRINNIFSMESRVKGIDSFEEKLYRKNYINKWEIPDNVSDTQLFIKQNLTDIIGLRINCYFTEYEEKIYESFRSFPDQEFILDFSEKTEQENGHKLYKFSGIYKGVYHFEVQVKSVIHNVWGETEHKNVYKNLSYDGYMKEKGVITNTLFEILKASDSQLYSIFHMEENEKQLLRSLFFCYTSTNVAVSCKTAVLARHYNNYFNSIENEGNVKMFIVSRLTETEFKPSALELSHKYDGMIEKLCTEFPIFYLRCLYHIDCVLHIHNSFNDFLSYFLETVLKEDEEDEFDKLQKDEFSGEPEIDEDLEVFYMAKINKVLGNCQIIKK